MAKLRAALIVMIILVALASWYKNQKREEAARTTSTPRPAHSMEMDAVPAATPIANPTAVPAPIEKGARVLPPEDARVVRECLAKSAELPRVQVTDSTTLETILADLSPKTDSARLNVHVKRSDGHEERLLVQPAEAASKHAYKIAGKELRVFDVDSEGLPIARNFPRDLKRDSLAHAVNAFIANDKVTFRERRSHFIIPGGVANAVETNGALTELQLNYGRTTLGCAWQDGNLNCACL